ncbi:MAG: hypothetical protein GWN01_17485 [Nitrosopumilaceae archaeon]|nr:hypothetical protein [Nitrosopumilaceae archaeon]NIU02617.1 hypothetical protein [Nitrosopumilaceae archaeon]NIU89080.1 hypothetical protein [Nitrosopumilaceae archaeon]NIV67183.1 hypothetical protein [Nitrosopumilaceae archaeon]NIX63218.1 hypothetical protein [Nitrosopumilaceae archaeon]
MGLIHTRTYIDFPDEQWKQISANPTIFEAMDDGISLEILDEGGKVHKISFKKGAQIKFMRVVGKYRLSWARELAHEES